MGTPDRRQCARHALGFASVAPVERGQTVARARVAVAGLTCGVGAMAAHLGAGGEVTAPAALLVVLCSVALGPVLLGRCVDAARTFALSLVVQVVWHVAFVLTTPSGEGMAHHVEAGVMALHHLAAAAVAALVAVGAERMLIAAAEWLLGVVLPVLGRIAAPIPAMRPALALDALAWVPDDQVHDPARPLRAPPRNTSLG